MSRDYVIRWLYRGGQAAIGAELLAILGVVIMAAVDRDLIFAQTNASAFEQHRKFVEAIYAHHVIYAIGVLMVTLAPSMAMLFVIWAWHHYFQSEGIRFMHWIATSVGLAGFVIRFLFATLDLVLLQDLAVTIHEGDITYREAYGALALIAALYIVSTAIIFGIYPLGLLVTSWEKRLLPMWFMIPAVVFAAINDLNVLYGTQVPFLTNLAGVVVILWPFLLGVVMLRKAQKLATDRYIETHGTPPTPTRHSGTTPQTQ